VAKSKHFFFRAPVRIVHAMFADQDAVDAAFADLDSLLLQREPPRTGCHNCGGDVFQRGTNPGHVCAYFDVCVACGCIANETFGMGDAARFPPRHSTSNYKRIHHWHERVSQLMLAESAIPDDQFLQIAECFLDGSHTVINKDAIRGVLRSLNMQLYIEKWLQIIHRITGIEPPKPGAQLLIMLDASFTDLQRPFAQSKLEKRKNFLNYNYVFSRLLQRLGCTQFSMFFPLIKSKAKLKALDQMWESMAKSIGWEVTPLVHVPPFAVKLEQPAALLEQIKRRVAAANPAVPREVLTEMVSRKYDRSLIHALDRQRTLKRRHTDPPAPELQKLGSAMVRPRPAKASKLRRLIQ